MSNYNPNSPGVLGLEWRPTIQQDITLAGPARGIAFRIVPGSTTLTAIHPFIKSVVATPGIAVEILSSLAAPAPVSTGEVEEKFFVAQDTGMLTTGWRTDSVSNPTAAQLRQAIDEYPPSTSDYITNSSSLGPNAKLQFAGRGNATALTGKRIEGIEIQLQCRTVRNENTNSDGPRVQGYVNIGGTTYLANRSKRAEADGKWRSPQIAEWDQNPSTNKPWTLAEVNNIISTTATDEFGFQIDSGRVAAQGFQCAELHVEVTSTGTTTGDYRMGSFYQPDPPVPGWNSYTLTNTSAESAATYYWVHIYPLSASGSFVIPILRDPRTDFRVTSAASATGEHRLVYFTNLGNGGVIQSYSTAPGSMIPVLVSAAGPTFNSQSQAYAELNNLTEDSTSPANLLQEFTTAAGPVVHYESMRIPLGWQTATPPSEPLTVEIRNTGAAPGSNLLARIIIPVDQTSQTLLDRAIDLGPGIDPPAATKHYAVIDSQAATGAGWLIGRLDTRSDFLVTPTAANVEGQSQGGQTDSQAYGTTAFDRYDIAFALAGAPGQVGGTPQPTLPVLTATVETGL